MSLSSQLKLMAEYNQCMNQRIYHAASQLSPTEINADKGAFFKSILGTLNHIWVGDVIWLKRFAEHESQLLSLEPVRALTKPTSLSSLVHSELSTLQQARILLDATIKHFTAEVNDDILSSNLSYHDTKGKPYTKHFGSLIFHLFNHQTHHRGQLSTLLNQAGLDVGVTDLLDIIPDIK